jgi:hypothetical protein
MKHLLLIIAVLFCTSTQAQKIDTVRNAVQVKPILFNWITKDSVYQVTWDLFQVSRDTTQGCNSYVQVYDRKGKKLYDKNVPIDKAILHSYPKVDAIDRYIVFALGLELK